MEKLLVSKSEKIISNLKTDREKSFTKLESFEINDKISSSLINAKREIEQKKKKSRIEASKIILSLWFMSIKKPFNNKREKKLSKIEIPDDANNDVLNKVIESQFKYSKIGYVIGIIIILFGLILTFCGIFYPLNKISIKFLSFSFSANNATPGIILFLVGLIVIISTRFSVKIKKKN